MGKKSSVVYPTAKEFLLQEAGCLVRGPLLAALGTCYIVRPFIFPPLLTWFNSVDLSFLPQVLVEYASNGQSSEGNFTSVRDVFFMTFCIMVLHISGFLVCSGIFQAFDTFGLMRHYRLPRTKRMLPSNRLFFTCYAEMFVTHFFVAPWLAYFVFTPWTSKLGGFLGGSATNFFIPLFDDGGLHGTTSVVSPPAEYANMSLLVTYLHFLLAHSTHDFMFYWAHRILHIPVLYKAIHKKHHMFIGTIAVASEYNNPIEGVFANLIPTFFWTVLVAPRFAGQEIALVWFIWRLVEGYEAHSGYNFKGSFLSRVGLLHASRCRVHDWHHTDNRGNFGVSGLWDWIHGTMDSYVEQVMTHPQTKEISLHEYYYAVKEDNSVVKEPEVAGEGTKRSSSARSKNTKRN